MKIFHICIVSLSLLVIGASCSSYDSQKTAAGSSDSTEVISLSQDSVIVARFIADKQWILAGWWPHSRGLAAVEVNKGDTLDAKDLELWIVRVSNGNLRRIGNAIKLYDFPPSYVEWLRSKPDYRLFALSLQYPTENVVRTEVFRVVDTALVSVYADQPHMCKATTWMRISDSLPPVLVSHSSFSQLEGGCPFECTDLAEMAGIYPTWATVRKWSGNVWVVDSTSPRNFYKQISKKYHIVADSLAANSQFQEKCNGYVTVEELLALSQRAGKLEP